MATSLARQIRTIISRLGRRRAGGHDAVRLDRRCVNGTSVGDEPVSRAPSPLSAIPRCHCLIAEAPRTIPTLITSFFPSSGRRREEEGRGSVVHYAPGMRSSLNSALWCTYNCTGHMTHTEKKYLNIYLWDIKFISVK